MHHFPSKLSFVAAACLLANVSSYGAQASHYTKRASYNRRTRTELIPYTPRVFVEGTAAPTGFLYGDTMIPLLGNTEGFAFMDGTGKAGTDKGWLGALGTGVREIWRGAIFGGYVFGEYDKTGLGNYYWTLNPGLEFMTPHWDIRANGYFPLGSRNNVNRVLFGSDLGITCPVFKGHQQFEQVFNDINEVAPGLDAQVGYIIPNLKRTRIFGGGYYYFFNHAQDIHGFVGGVELPLNQTMSLLFRDSYDNVHKNTAVFTIRAYFGGMNKIDENDIHERLLDPMERHIGVLYTGSGIPAEQVIYDTGALRLQRDNIWFFRPGGTPGDKGVGPQSCTYENPCNSDQFNQVNINNINGIAKYANFYLADGGTYFIGPLTLNLGQSIYGRTEDFCQVACSPLSPLLLGNLTLKGSNTLQAFRLSNQLVPVTDQTAGIGINAINVSGINIDKVSVGPILTMLPHTVIEAGTFQTGILLDNAQNVTITNSKINAADIKTNRAPVANAVIAQNKSSVTLIGDTLNTRLVGTAATTDITFANQTNQASALYLHNNGEASLFDNQLNMVSEGSNFQSGNPALVMQSTGISIVNDRQATPSILNSANDRFNLTTYVSQKAGTAGRIYGTSYGIFLRSRAANGQITVKSTNDQFTNNISSVQNGNFSTDSYIGRNVGMEIINQGGTVDVNLSGDLFYSMNNAQNNGGTGSDAGVNSGIAVLPLTSYSISYSSATAQHVGVSKTMINSLNNRFDVNSQAFATRRTGYVEAYVENSGIFVRRINNLTRDSDEVVINSKGDVFNVRSDINANATNQVYFQGVNIPIRCITTASGPRRSLIILNTSNDTFNVNDNTVAKSISSFVLGSDLLRGIYSTVSSSGGIHLINSQYDTFNLNRFSRIEAATNAQNSVDMVGVSARGTSNTFTMVINLKGDTFNLTSIDYTRAATTSGTFNVRGIYATQGARVNLINFPIPNVFRFKIRRNGVPTSGQPFFASGGAVITNLDTAKFLNY